MSDRETLPYRTTGEDLERFISAYARGRDMNQIHSLFTSTPNFRGTTSAAENLDLYDPEAEQLTSLGERLALGDSEEKKKVLFSSVIEYEPYELLLEAIFAGGVTEEDEMKYTPTEWIESWWGANEYGSSHTNRSEGSTAFAKIISYLEVGEYKQGRHSYPSRIEWAPDAEQQVEDARKSLEGHQPQADKEELISNEEDSKNRGRDPKSRGKFDSPPENNALTLHLGDDRLAKLSLPPSLTRNEKERLVSMVKLMISTVEGSEDTQMEMEM